MSCLLSRPTWYVVFVQNRPTILTHNVAEKYHVNFSVICGVSGLSTHLCKMLASANMIRATQLSNAIAVEDSGRLPRTSWAPPPLYHGKC